MPDLAAARTALAREAEVREWMRGRRPDDPVRREALTEVYEELKAANRPLTTYVRCGPQVGRRTTGDPVRAAHREIRAARTRVRAALNRTSGSTPPWVEAPSAQSMWAHLGNFQQLLVDIEHEHAILRRMLGPGKLISSKDGGSFRSVAELNEEARALLDKLRIRRRALRTAHDRFRYFGPRRGHEDKELRDEVADRIMMLRDQADLLTAELHDSATRRTPVAGTRLRQRWTVQVVTQCLRAFHARNGRLPTARELNGDPGLPPYTVLHRMLGASPLREAERLL